MHLRMHQLGIFHLPWDLLMNFCPVCTLPNTKLNLEGAVQVLYRLDFGLLTQRTLDGKSSTVSEQIT